MPSFSIKNRHGQDINVILVGPKTNTSNIIDPSNVSDITNTSSTSNTPDTPNTINTPNTIDTSTTPNISNQIVILVHGLCSHKNAIFFPALSTSLTQQSYWTCRFDMPLYHSDNTTFRYGAFAEDVADLQEIFSYCTNQLSLKPIALIGHSRGANVVMHYALMHPEMPLSIIGIAGRFVMQGGLKKHPLDQIAQLQKEGKAFEWKVKCRGNDDFRVTVNTDGLSSYLSQQLINDRMYEMPACHRVMVLHGTGDETTNVEDAHSFERLLKQSGCECQLTEIDNAGHGFRGYEEPLIKAINSFLSLR